ncbi:uncharacterized protein IUM83_18991 [Phytophthora cinnamomi]|uniref:uncharacterized protein n=1 Tax=Phytophthora cinnamomi TaxID=4785 RepID=UPI00355A66AF|nr:hypothetical protein IUM83_18991 [Phytophthora cinnamomi]
MPDADFNVADDEVYSTPSDSSTDDSDSDNSATRVELPSSPPGWLVPMVKAAFAAVFRSTVLRLDAVIGAVERIEPRLQTVIDSANAVAPRLDAIDDAIGRIAPRMEAAIAAAFAEVKSYLNNRVDDLLANIRDKLHEHQQALGSELRAIDAKNKALEAELRGVKKDLRLLLESREGGADILDHARSAKRLRSQTDPESSTFHTQAQSLLQ